MTWNSHVIAGEVLGMAAPDDNVKVAGDALQIPDVKRLMQENDGQTGIAHQISLHVGKADFVCAGFGELG